MADAPTIPPHQPDAPPPPPGPTPIRPLDYGRRSKGSALGERVVDMLKTLVWVAPLTVLIWVYAEREQSDRRENVTVPIAVKINATNRIVVLVDPPDKNLVVTLSGPRTALQRVIDQVQSNPDKPLISYAVDPGIRRGTHAIPATVIANNPVFTQNGIAVRDPSPRQITVEVDDLESRPLPVRPAVMPPNLEGQPRFVPGDVVVRAPRSTFERAEAEGRAFVTADLSKLDELRQPGKHEVLGVPVSWAYHGDAVVIETPTVTASFEVNKQEVEVPLAGIPIWPAGPAGFLEHNAVKLPDGDTLPNLRVAGPKEQTDLLTTSDPDKRYPVVATLYVTSRDPREGRKELRIDLPPGVHVVSRKDEYTVNYRIVEHGAD